MVIVTLDTFQNMRIFNAIFQTSNTLYEFRPNGR